MARLSKKKILTEMFNTLPDRFYWSQEVYDLERRAIFSKRWFLVSHKARYREVGDYVQYDMAGFNFVVLKNKMGDMVGFHNICRCASSRWLSERFSYQQTPRLSRGPVCFWSRSDLLVPVPWLVI